MIAVVAIALIVYLRTLAPTITWSHHGADGGDLITAVATRGVPHPPGYPTYTLLGRIFLLIPWGDRAHRLNLMSAVFAALAAGLLYLALLSTFRLFRSGQPGLPERFAAGAAALALAFSPLFWSQALITEVYTLNAFFVSLVVYLVLRWMEQPSDITLSAIALACGLGMGNHLTILMLVPALLIVLWPRREHLPASAWGAMTVGLPFFLGLGVYAYLPIAAAHHPPVNWGDPSSLHGFFWTVSGRIYREYFFGLPLRHLPSRLSAWSALVVQQTGWWGFILSLVGCWALWQRARDVALFSSVLFLAYSAYAIGYDTTDSQVNLIPALLLFALWLGWGLVFLLDELDRLSDSTARFAHTLSLGLILLVPLLSLACNFSSLDVSADSAARDYGAAVLKALEPNAILVSQTDRHTFTLWYVRYAERRRTDVALFDADLLHFAWYRANAGHVHPDIVLSDRVAVAMGTRPPGLSLHLSALVEDNWDTHPIYFTDPGSQVKNRYRLSQEGAVHRVIGLREG